MLGREYAVAITKRNGKDFDIKNKKFQVIKNGFNYWVADPFPVEFEGVLYIFGEIFKYSSLKGTIGYTKLVNGQFTPWKIVIDEPYHLSFPNIFLNNNIFYMCPEANESGELYLYKCINFPEKWVKDRILAQNTRYSDTIFYKQKESVYGFTCIWKSIKNHIFKYFKIENGKIEISNGKIDTLDYYLTRPAGKIFYDSINKKDIMVSQICQPLYGSGLIFKEFSINWPDYYEKELYRIYPKDIIKNVKHNYVGIHTFNMTENYIVVDLVWNRLNIIEKYYRALRKIKKFIKVVMQ